jgi:type I restriction enzyme S subunit
MTTKLKQKNTETNIPKGWSPVTLGDVCEISSSKRIFSNEYKTSGVPFFRGKEVTEKYNGNKVSTELFITEEKYDDIKSKYGVPLEGDILLTSVGTLGNPYVVEKDFKFYFKDGNLTWFHNYSNIDSNFLYYWLISPEGKEGLSHAVIGSTQQAYTMAGLNKVSINIPTLPEQKSIADVLFSLDNKVELLRKQNETLEKTSQTIFNDWFGKYQVGDDLPVGWRVGKITEIIEKFSVPYRCVKSDLDLKGKTPIFDQGSDGFYGYTNREPDFIASKENPVILFTNHTCNYWFVDYPFCAIQNVLPYRGTHGYDTYFLYFMTKESVSFIEYKGHWPDFEAKDFIIPPVDLAQDFSVIAEPTLRKISENNSQIKTLTKTRDVLLLKLMKGEIRVT